MTMGIKRSIFKEYLAEWLAAKGDRKRGEMTREISHIAKIHPKSVPRSFRRAQMHDSGIPEKRGRMVVYGADVNAALKDIAEAASWSCGENLHDLIPEYIRIFKRDGVWKHPEETTSALLAISVATVKRRAAKFSHIRKMVTLRNYIKSSAIRRALEGVIGF